MRYVDEQYLQLVRGVRAPQRLRPEVNRQAQMRAEVERARATERLRHRQRIRAQVRLTVSRPLRRIMQAVQSAESNRSRLR